MNQANLREYLESWKSTWKSTVLSIYESARECFGTMSEARLAHYEPSREHSQSIPNAEQTRSLLLKRLPDDILIIIIDNLCLGHNQRSTIISHVCRRLRHIVLDSPHLWTTIDSKMSVYNVQLSLARSKDAGLSIKLHDLERGGRRDPVKELDEFMALVAPETSRWVSFEFRPTHIPFWRETFQTLLKHLQHRPVPRLERMHIGMLQEYSWLFADSDVPHTLLQFYSTWDTPALTHLTVNNSIPPPQFGKTLTSFELYLNKTIAFIHDWSLTELHAFLSTCTLLQHLTLRLRTLAIDASPTDLGTIHLPVLQSYTAVVSSYRASAAFLRLTSVLHTPNLSCWSVVLELEAESDQPRLVHRLFDSPNDFNALRELNLSVYHELHEPFPLYLIFARLQQLHHLSVKVPRAEFPPVFEAPSSNPPPLRSLTLTTCRKMSAEFFKDVMVALKGGKAWPEFRELTLHECQAVTEEDVRVVVPEHVTVYR